MVFIKGHPILCIIFCIILIILCIIWRIKRKRKRDGYIERFVPHNQIQHKNGFNSRKGYISYESETKKSKNWFSEKLDGLGVLGEFIKSIIELFKGVGEIFEGFGGGGSGGHW